MQGAVEFKTEIELLSRIHHKNVVGLVGFCYEQGEQMLVYEYISKGTLRDCISGSLLDCHLIIINYCFRELFGILLHRKLKKDCRCQNRQIILKVMFITFA